jgi:hypothetical protein
MLKYNGERKVSEKFTRKMHEFTYYKGKIKFLNIFNISK